jgi:hypothetical protein
MGYDLHITRKKYWCDEEGPVISPEEWLAVVRDDPELTLSAENGPYFANWSGPSRYPDPWLDYFEGDVFAKNPDDPLIEKMVQIADRLGAKVQGDDGEVYPGAGQSPRQEEPDETEEMDQVPARNSLRPWWKRLIGR